jgi:hypothetical protein
VLVVLVNLSNGREIGSFDTIPTMLLPLTILRGDGLSLDRFRPLLREEAGTLPVFLSRSGGRIVSRYPVGAALVVLPFYAPQIAALDTAAPGWDRDLTRAYLECKRMSKRTAAILAGLLAIALHRLIRQVGLGRVAAPTVVAAMLGSDLWTVAGQSLWQHGPAALALTLSALLLCTPSPGRARFFLAGVTTAVMAAVRSLDLIFAVVILAWVAWNHSRRLAWFLPASVVLGLALVAYNLVYFGTVLGGQDELEQLHRQIHGVGGPWSGDLWAGMAGTLFSPNRGLFVFSPWIALALAAAPFSARRLASWSLLVWLSWSLVAYLLVLSKYAVWWAGGSFGPRYWTDAMPLFAVLLACGLDWAGDRSRGLSALFGLAIALAVFVQIVGAFCYPSTWNFYPADVDQHHERLWDWRDTEVSRCVRESWLGERPPIHLQGR